MQYDVYAWDPHDLGTWASSTNMLWITLASPSTANEPGRGDLWPYIRGYTTLSWIRVGYLCHKAPLCMWSRMCTSLREPMSWQSLELGAENVHESGEGVDHCCFKPSSTGWAKDNEGVITSTSFSFVYPYLRSIVLELKHYLIEVQFFVSDRFYRF